jgi:hypothetical protein
MQKQVSLVSSDEPKGGIGGIGSPSKVKYLEEGTA